MTVPALTRSVAIVPRAQALGVRALEAEALLVQGRAARMLRGSTAADRVDPRTSLYAAWLAAEAGEHRVAAAEALVELTTWVTDARAFDEVQTWSARAQAQLDALSGVERLRARLHWALGAAEAWQGRFESAYAHLDEAKRRLGDPNDPWMGRILNTEGEVAFAEADYDRAESGYRALLAAVTEQYGPEHLWVSDALGNLGEVALARHDLDTARDLFDRSRRIRAHVLGPDSYWVAHTSLHLADVHRRAGDLDAARAEYQRALDAPPADADPSTCDRGVWAHHGLALIALAEGDPEAAWSHAAPSLDAAPKTDPHHLDLCDRFDIHARILLARGEPERALTFAARALERLEAIAGPNHHGLVPLLVVQGDILRTLGREADAAPGHARAKAIHRRDPATEPAVAAALPLVR